MSRVFRHYGEPAIGDILVRDAVGFVPRSPALVFATETAHVGTPGAFGPNIVGGASAIASDLSVCTIGGGGRVNWENVIGGDPSTQNNGSTPNTTVLGTGADYGTISGGYDHVVNGIAGTIAGGGHNLVTGGHGAIGGGSLNQATNQYTAIAGGTANHATGASANVAGGNTNTASGAPSTVGGGLNNTASGISSTVTGGQGNTASGTVAACSGRDNLASGDYSTIGGGRDHTATAIWTTVAGGDNNDATNTADTVGGGANNTTGGGYSTVGGGDTNAAGGVGATVSGGRRNTASGLSATIGGGTDHTAGAGSTVGGGTTNAASGNTATVAGGTTNTASATSATVGGGQNNNASGIAATIPGGRENLAGGASAFAIGREASAYTEGMVAHSAGKIAAVGDAQAGRLVLRAQTTNGTGTIAGVNGTNGASHQMQQDSACTFRMMVVARDTSANDAKGWTVQGLALNNTSASVSFPAGAPTPSAVDATAGAAAWTVAVSGGTDSLVLTVTGEAGKTINWVALVEFVEVVA